jgi:hypothetical protein
MFKSEIRISITSRRIRNTEENIFYIIIYFRFPSDRDRCQLWMKNLRYENWCPSQYSKICSLHFEPRCFLEGMFDSGNYTVCITYAKLFSSSVNSGTNFAEPEPQGTALFLLSESHQYAGNGINEQNIEIQHTIISQRIKFASFCLFSRNRINMRRLCSTD